MIRFVATSNLNTIYPFLNALLHLSLRKVAIITGDSKKREQ